MKKTSQTHYKFKIDDTNELTMDIPEGVFVPTGTSSVLLKAIRQHIRHPGKTLDIGCGCGVLGIALHKLGLIKMPLYVSDLSQKAIECVEKNAKIHKCSVVARYGFLFEPWLNEKFDYIVDDVSGVAEEVARISSWFNNVPCNSGSDGTDLVVKIIQEAKNYLNPGGFIFFPVISLSRVDKIVDTARKNFSHVKRLLHEEWPLPKDMHQHGAILKKLQEEGCIQIAEKFGMILYFTDVYVAYNRRP